MLRFEPASHFEAHRMPALKSRILTTIDEIASIDFGIETTVETPFFTRAWLSSWCKHYLGKNDSIHTIVVYDEDRVVGIAPLCIQKIMGKGNVLRFLGNGEVCSDYQTFPSSSPADSEVVSALANQIYGCVNQWDRIELDGIRADNSLMTALMGALEEFDLSVHVKSIASCWRLPLPSTMEEYFAQNSKNHRKRARQKLKLFESGSIDVLEANDSASFERGFAVLRDLHQRRRNSLGEPGCFASEAYDNFLYEAARGLLEDDMLRLFWLESAGEPIAADIAIKSANGIFAYQAGISPEHLAYEPGRLATLWHIKRAIEDGQNFVDFLRGDEPYKKLLHAKPIACVKYEVVPPKMKSQAYQAFVTAGRNLKAILSSSPIPTSAN